MRHPNLAPPPGGWKQNTFYHVKVAWGPNNPIHSSIFYCGFLDNGRPANYSCVMNPHGYVFHDTDKLYYFSVVREILSSEEFDRGISDMPPKAGG